MTNRLLHQESQYGKYGQDTIRAKKRFLPCCINFNKKLKSKEERELRRLLSWDCSSE